MPLLPDSWTKGENPLWTRRPRKAPPCRGDFVFSTSTGRTFYNGHSRSICEAKRDGKPSSSQKPKSTQQQPQQPEQPQQQPQQPQQSRRARRHVHLTDIVEQPHEMLPFHFAQRNPRNQGHFFPQPHIGRRRELRPSNHQYYARNTADRVTHIDKHSSWYARPFYLPAENSQQTPGKETSQSTPRAPQDQTPVKSSPSALTCVGESESKTPQQPSQTPLGSVGGVYASRTHFMHPAMPEQRHDRIKRQQISLNRGRRRLAGEERVKRSREREAQAAALARDRSLQATAQLFQNYTATVRAKQQKSNASANRFTHGAQFGRSRRQRNYIPTPEAFYKAQQQQN